MIHIGRGSTNLGSFSEDEVRRGLATGRFSMTDLGWKEGMENWAPLSQFPELAPPVEEMPPLPEEEMQPLPEALPHAPGLPWDERKERGIVTGFAQTAQLVLTRPSEAFARMQKEGGLSGPLLYNLIGGCIGLIAAGGYAVLTARLQQPIKSMGGAQGQLQALYESPVMAMAALKMFCVMGPVFVTMIAMISAALTHLFLMLAGGANKAFHMTLRVFCFSYGSTQLLELLPFCGGLLAMLWLAVCCIVGLTIAHETTMGRAVTAMVLFVAASSICCVGIIFLAAAAGYQSLQPMIKQ